MRPIIGTEAIATGALTRGRLRSGYTAIHPNVYLPNGALRTIELNAEAAVLWTGRTGIVAGRAAAALHGVVQIDASIPIDLFANHGRRRPGIVVHEERVAEDEVRSFDELRVTTPARTALDLARWLPRDEAVRYLDELARATEIGHSDVSELLDRYRGARGVPGAHAALRLMDGGSRSPDETRLRLILADSQFPRPRTSIVVSDGLGGMAVIGMAGPSSRLA